MHAAQDGVWSSPQVCRSSGERERAEREKREEREREERREKREEREREDRREKREERRERSGFSLVQELQAIEGSMAPSTVRMIEIAPDNQVNYQCHLTSSSRL